MNLKKKKHLAAKTLKTGKERLVFVNARLGEIKDAITKQDIRDLYASGAILIKEISGRRKIKKSKSRAGVGKIKLKVNSRKADYIKLTRKLRAYLKSVARTEGISKEKIKLLLIKIRNKEFKSKAQFKEFLKKT